MLPLLFLPPMLFAATVDVDAVCSCCCVGGAVAVASAAAKTVGVASVNDAIAFEARVAVAEDDDIVLLSVVADFEIRLRLQKRCTKAGGSKSKIAQGDVLIVE